MDASLFHLPSDLFMMIRQNSSCSIGVVIVIERQAMYHSSHVSRRRRRRRQHRAKVATALTSISVRRLH